MEARLRDQPAYPNLKEGDLVVRDVELRRGERLPEVRLHYTTLGTPRRDAAGRITNAVLLLHGTTQTSRSFFAPTVGPELFGPGQVLDASRWYVIVPDGLGRGGSTKPSDGLRARFPRYGFEDVVTGHHLVVTKALEVDHLRAVVGVSMGGMMAWMWGERFPGMADALMPIACQPVQISGRNLLWRRIISESIRNDPDWNGGDYEAQPRRWTLVAPLFAIMADSPVRLQAQGPTRQAAMALYDELVAEARKLDANDVLYVHESSWDYDPEPRLSRIDARVLAVNFEDDELNPPELGVMERLVARVPNARFALVPRSERTIGHRTVTLAAVWKPYLEELLRALPPEGTDRGDARDGRGASEAAEAGRSGWTRERTMETKKANMEWEPRDDLAAMFMQALITGRMAGGHVEPSSEAKIWAGKAYALADGFLAARKDLLELKP